MSKSLHGNATPSLAKTLKIGADIFVNLKEGSIGSYYNFGKVLG